MKKLFFVIFIYLIIFISCSTTENTKNSNQAIQVIQEEIPVDIILTGYEIDDVLKNIQSELINDVEKFNYAEEIQYDDGGTLLLVWAYNTIYHSKKYLTQPFLENIGDWRYFLQFYYKSPNSEYKTPVNNVWFSVNGKAEKIILKTTTPDKITIYSDVSIGFKGEGLSTVIISFLNKNMQININTEIVPIFPDFFKGDTGNDLIERYGLPDNIKDITVSYPKKELIDGFLYNPKPGESLGAEHWRYKKFPDCVIKLFKSGKVVGVTTSRDKTLYKQWQAE